MSSLVKVGTEVAARRPHKFKAQNSTYSLSEQVVVEMRIATESIDFENTRAMFKVTFGASTDARMVRQFASQLIKTLRVKTLSGTTIGNDSSEYRAAQQMYREFLSTNEKDVSWLSVMEGADGPNLADAGSTIQFAHKIDDHLFALKEYYPAHLHTGFQVEFDLADAINEVTAELANTGDALPASISVTDFYIVADLVRLKPKTALQILELQKQELLFVDYIQNKVVKNQMNNNTNNDYDITGIDGRVRAAFSFMIAAGDRDDDWEPYFGLMRRHNLQSYRFQLGDRYINYAQIPLGTNQKAEQIFELSKALDNHTMDRMVGNSTLTPTVLGGEGAINSTTAAADSDRRRFVVGVKLTRDQQDVDLTLSSMKDINRNMLRVELEHSAVPGGTGTIYTVIPVDKRIRISSSGVIERAQS